jgi:hypothetical protein
MSHQRRQFLCFALFLGAASLGATQACATADTSQATGDVRLAGDKTRPHLIFGCDRQTPELESLVTPALIADLKELGAGVALSTEDFSPERAEVVRRLNAAGIPMIAWIALPRSEGYYVNVSTAPQTAARFAAFDKWTRDYGLHWQAVGLDIEPTLQEYGAVTGNVPRLASMIVKRYFDHERVRRARGAYQTLIRQMRSRGYRVQSYQLAFIADERRGRSSLLQRLFGIVDIRGDEEALMLYTSLSEPFGAGLIWAYGAEAQIVAVGSTALSGDAALDAKYPPLSWEKFSRDLRVARHFSKSVGIYSLEGCVRQGFMSRLKTMD